MAYSDQQRVQIARQEYKSYHIGQKVTIEKAHKYLIHNPSAHQN